MGSRAHVGEGEGVRHAGTSPPPNPSPGPPAADGLAWTVLALQQLGDGDVADRLHDGVAQSLTGLQMLLRALHSGSAPNEALLDRVERGLQDAQRELREATRRLLPPTRHPTRPDLAIRADLSAEGHQGARVHAEAGTEPVPAALTAMARLVVHHAAGGMGGEQVITVSTRDGHLHVTVRCLVGEALAEVPAVVRNRHDLLRTALAAVGGTFEAQVGAGGMTVHAVLPSRG